MNKKRTISREILAFLYIGIEVKKNHKIQFILVYFFMYNPFLHFRLENILIPISYKKKFQKFYKEFHFKYRRIHQ